LSNSPSDILRSLPEKNVLERLDTLIHIFDVVFRDFKDIHLDFKLLRHVIVSYFFDLNRMKAFHGIDFADQLHYRQTSPEILSSAMYLLECACLGTKP
jgi:hypothetical protein